MKAPCEPTLFTEENIWTGGLKVRHYPFRSKAVSLLPSPDRDIKGNVEFDFRMITRDDNLPASSLVLLLHGFNEKRWDKYLSWGEAICRGTGSAVLFFPIAFHMQRAPELWKNSRAMYRLSVKRRNLYPGIRCTSLSNAAISTRIQEHPSRLLWSGMQSYYDVIQLLNESREGRYDQICPDFSLNLFGYSIGGFLAEILKMSDPGGLFRDSKVCLFCSGPVFRSMSPVSRYILDSEANRALQDFLSGNPGFLLNDFDPVAGRAFLAMLDYGSFTGFREQFLQQHAREFYAIALKKDGVIPPVEVQRTLKGELGEIPVRVDEIDFPYPYSHENPFYATSGNGKERNLAFRQVFSRFCRFLVNRETETGGPGHAA